MLRTFSVALSWAKKPSSGANPEAKNWRPRWRFIPDLTRAGDKRGRKRSSDRAASLPLFSANYVGVSMRHINRPLVAVPENLAPEEEAYWLPHVFNPSVSEARRDYIDFHGGRLSGPRGMDQGDGDTRLLPIATFVSRLNDIAARVSDIDQLYVRSSAGAMVPLSGLVTISTVQGADAINWYNLYPAVLINGSSAHGHSSGQAIAAMEQVARQHMPRACAVSPSRTSGSLRARKRSRTQTSSWPRSTS